MRRKILEEGVQIFDSMHEVLKLHLESGSEGSEPSFRCSRKHHKSMNTCLNKKLVCDVFRQKKRAGAVAISDAKGCYDVISHPIAVLTLMSFGVPPKVCKVLFSTLQKTKHHIKTGFGRSEAVYGDE